MSLDVHDNPSAERDMPAARKPVSVRGVARVRRRRPSFLVGDSCSFPVSGGILWWMDAAILGAAHHRVRVGWVGAAEGGDGGGGVREELEARQQFRRRDGLTLILDTRSIRDT